MTAGLTAQRRLVAHLAAAALEPAFSFGKIVSLARRDDDQQTPEFVAVAELGKTPLFHPATEAVERAQSGIFLVFCPPLRSPKFHACQCDQPMEIAFPQLLGGNFIPGFQLVEPARDRSITGHHEARFQVWRRGQEARRREGIIVKRGRTRDE